MGQELLDFRRTEVPGMMPLMDVSLAPEPLYVGLFGAECRGPDPQFAPRHLEQPGWVRHAPYLRGKLGDISTAANDWNQRIASRSSRLSDAFVQFLSAVWAVYL